jgi:hypothetical protein
MKQSDGSLTLELIETTGESCFAVVFSLQSFVQTHQLTYGLHFTPITYLLFDICGKTKKESKREY